MGPYLKSRIRRVAVIGLFCTFGVTQPTVASESAPLVSIAKNVIRTAAKIGLNEAGTRILGPTAWEYFKEIFSPVWAELEKRYPALQLTGAKQAEAAAEQAATALDKDDHLQQTLADGFKKLETGQAAILVECNRINEALQRTGRELSDIKVLTAEALEELQRLREQQSTARLLEVDEFAKIEGESPAKDVAHLAILLVKFSWEVLERGDAMVAYSRILPFYSAATPNGFVVAREPTEYVVTAYGPFQDRDGQTCRWVSVTYFRNGSWQSYGRTLYCRVEGVWEAQRQ